MQEHAACAPSRTRRRWWRVLNCRACFYRRGAGSRWTLSRRREPGRRRFTIATSWATGGCTQDAADTTHGSVAPRTSAPAQPAQGARGRSEVNGFGAALLMPEELVQAQAAKARLSRPAAGATLRRAHFP